MACSSPVQRWGQVSQSLVGALLVVGHEPLVGDALGLLKVREGLLVEHLGAKRTVEAFDVGVLRRLARSEELPFDTAGVGAALNPDFRFGCGTFGRARL